MKTSARHALPFGAECEPGAVRFRFWAPSAVRVELEIDGELQPLSEAAQGWFETRAERAAAGSRYRYRIDGELWVPDPASRFNPDGVHGASEVIDPEGFDWGDESRVWSGRPWAEAVVYELHVGAFSPRGDYQGVIERLDYLAELGVTAIELMPLASAPGTRGWGYDGVLPFAPNPAYGRPEDLKRLIRAAHRRGLMVLLDVVYNHFGPEGNYLHRYAERFFRPERPTPWGAALNFDGPDSDPVRDFFIHNALYWLREYRFDGLRLDAVHAIHDDGERHFLDQLAAAVAEGPSRERELHLILENDDNQAEFLDGGYTAQWNDDAHHALHVLLTAEDRGYYQAYAGRGAEPLARCLSEGFYYQGQAAAHRQDAPRGTPSAHLPLTAFVNFLQNHDQIGNRAFGERLHSLAEDAPQSLRAALAVLLLAPSPPLLFMGEEFAASSPFLYFCDFGPELAAAVSAGRRREFGQFPEFSDPRLQATIPDPGDPATFAASRLRWEELEQEPHAEWLRYYCGLLQIRRQHIVPLLIADPAPQAAVEARRQTALALRWRFANGAALSLRANLGAAPISLPQNPAPEPLLFATVSADADLGTDALAPWSVCWRLEPPV